MGGTAMKKCPACDIVLSRSDRETGWCDGWGKKLPASLWQSVSRDVDRAIREQARRSGRSASPSVSTIEAALTVVIAIPFLLFGTFLVATRGPNTTGLVLICSALAGL